MLRAWICLGLVFLLASPQAARPQPPPDTPVIDDVIDVRVVNVEAVVTDADGKMVRGLGPADFRLLVDGREVAIDYFSEIAEGQAASAPPRPLREVRRRPWHRPRRWRGAISCSSTTPFPSPARAMRP